jgi:hypothetical protein
MTPLKYLLEVTMEAKMSRSTRRELLSYTRKRYINASWREKGKILDEFIALTGYDRKYGIKLLNLVEIDFDAKKTDKQRKNKKYDEAIRQALLTIWGAANQICSKRLVPFIPELLSALERFGHIALPEDVRSKLLTISPATVDRLLERDRKESKKGLCTTRSGSLLKHQIKVRTFADWDDVVPGFLEGDLVAHCGETTKGVYLNTLVITDIASAWTEFFPILYKCEANVIEALKAAQQLLPFPLLGLDTDNGTEFINYALLEFCKENKITFTRSRPYKKNDQAHVEEKNGSIVRRLVGYDRYEGLDAYNALSELYAILRLYINFFQPSLKLLSKKRDGAKVTKKYDKAKTPYQRLLLSPHLTDNEKLNLRNQYDKLDPLDLLKKLEKLQETFWQHAWKQNVETKSVASSITHHKISELIDPYQDEIVMGSQSVDSQKASNHQDTAPIDIRRYRKTAKPRKELSTRTWRTRPDPFENEWDKIKLKLELDPERTARSFLDDLIAENASQFSSNQLRTLQRRISNWRVEQLKMHQETHCKINNSRDDSAKTYVSLVAHAMMSK